MTLVEDGADIMIGEFGETVTVYPQSGQVPEDSSDPIYFDTDEDTSSSNGTDYDVRLYTTPSNEQMEEYGFDENTESMMYSTSDVADEGDVVEYSAQNYEWIVSEVVTSQIGEGAYMFVYSLMGR